MRVFATTFALTHEYAGIAIGIHPLVYIRTRTCGGKYTDTEVDVQAHIMHTGTYTNMRIDAYTHAGVCML